MTAGRVRLVWRFGSSSTRSRWFVGSLVAHGVFAAAIVLWPSSPRAIRGPIGPSIAVDLVGAPAAGAAVAAARPEPEPARPQSKPAAPPPETPKPKAAALEPRKVEVVDKPAERPEPPVPEPEPVPTRKPADEASDGTAGAASGAPAEAPGAGEAGESGVGIAGAVGGGGNVLGSEYAWYGARVTAALRAHWRRPPLGNVREPLTVVVSFSILRDGTVRSPEVVDSSGVPSLDRSALRAVVDASPLPALPRTLAATVVPARFEFTWYPGES